jgi:Caspase domain
MTFLARSVVFVLSSFLGVAGSLAQAQAIDTTPRTALVFGNAAYSAPDRPLKNPVSDARLMARTLKELGFDVRLREDVDRRSMLQALRELEETLRKTKGVGFVYFAGHGVQVNGRNYIVPIGANLVRDVDAQKNAIDADAVLQSLRDTGAKLNILVLDACRNNPLLATSRSTGAAGAKAGLAPMRPPEGALVAFATEPGRLASDGKETGNGLYTRHLAKWIKEPDLTLEQVFKRTREAVQLESKGEQIPTEYSVLTGADLYLGGNSASGNTSKPISPTTAGIPSKNSSPGTVVASRSTEPYAPSFPLPDTGSARLRLAQLGAGYTKQSYQLAFDNDDLPVFELLVASGWKVETWDIVRLLDPREMPSGWPKKIMTSVAQNGRKTPLGEELCDSGQMKKRFNNVVDILKRGYDSPEMAGARIIFERESLNRTLAPRRDFYKQLCGSAALAQN